MFEAHRISPANLCDHSQCGAGRSSFLVMAARRLFDKVLACIDLAFLTKRIMYRFLFDCCAAPAQHAVEWRSHRSVMHGRRIDDFQLIPVAKLSS